MLALLAQVTSAQVPTVDLHAILPEVIIAVGLLAVLTIDVFLPDEYKEFNAVISMLSIGAAAVALITLVGDPRTTFGGMFVVDSYALLFKFMFLASVGVLVMMSFTYLRETVQRMQGEFYFLLLTALLGMMVMPSARDMLALFIALETVTVPGFILAGFRKADERSNEAAVKFFLFGVLSSAVMLFGMSLIYGVTHSTNLAEIGRVLTSGETSIPNANALVYASVLMIIVGFAFKVSAVPFHFWAPDTYEGSPTPVTAFLAVGSKAAGFAGLLQITFVAFPAQSHIWAPGFAILAVATMTLGNLVALSQTNIVRLLAYSSIGQAGYILLPFAIVANQSAEIQQEAFASALTYILIYSFMSLGAFAVVIAVGRRHGSYLVSDYEGLAAREPGLAMAMLIFLLSLAGMIPTAGFWAKFYVFKAAIGADAIYLAAIMVVNTLIGLYYYLSVGAKMYLREPSDREHIGVPLSLAAAIVMMVVIVAAVTVQPDFFSHFSPRSTLIAR